MVKWLTRRLGKARLLRWFMGFYPPYLGAGVRVRPISDDIHDGAGTLVARVEKTLYVRLKPQARQA
ncbi:MULTISPECIES: hypothetical protein [unclassified Pseudomonas]|jgi:hypothetical protein|uniref:hypothetical protein n=1 Tax=unclassified Pseudomonas TaxID=196821 RepID=UPI000BA3B746|nr:MULTISPECIES: hypothetical protein [unclassified Pseudomonas]MDX9665857.1 hypothetical protein [Pseudomonas sp. P5_152]QHD03783.1 hypothetical protein PspS04_26965 [Pseudomonas sp. S04]QHF36268.1 hypothetical protein PspS19_26975 [Pseudomonas sp. S19]